MKSKTLLVIFVIQLCALHGPLVAKDSFGSTADSISISEKLYTAASDPDYMSENFEAIQADIAEYQPTGTQVDLSVVYFAFELATLETAQSLCENFGKGARVSFSDEAFLECIAAIYLDMLEKYDSGHLDLAPLQADLLRDEIFLITGEQDATTLSSIGPFSYYRAQDAVEKGHLSDPSLTVAMANGSVCSGHKLPKEMRLDVFDLCFDPVDYSAALEDDSLKNFSVVLLAVQVCASEEKARQSRCIPRLQESLRPFGSCKLPIYLMASLEAIEVEIYECFSSIIQDLN